MMSWLSFAAELLVLRDRADRGELEDAVVAADARRAFDDDVRADRRAVADLDAGADDAVGADTDVRADACGRIDDRGRVDHQPRHLGAEEFGLRCGFAVDLRLALEEAHVAHRALLLNFEAQLIARHDDAVEARVVDLDEIEDAGVLSLRRRRKLDEHAAGLRHRFDDEHARHHRMAWEVALEELLR